MRLYCVVKVVNNNTDRMEHVFIFIILLFSRRSIDGVSCENSTLSSSLESINSIESHGIFFLFQK